MPTTNFTLMGAMMSYTHFHTFNPRLFHSLFVLVMVLFFTACDKKNIPPDLFTGKTKQEVLEIIFKESPRTYDGSLNIMIVTTEQKYRKCNNLYYKNLDDALKDPRLMTAEIWQVDFRKVFAISIFQHVRAIELHFKDGKVVKCEITTWKET